MSATVSNIKNFATLFRGSKFITLGDFRNATVLGKVFHVVDNDLYIDFGMKFHAVVKRPQKDARLYVRGSTVKLKLLDYEISDKFIGTDHFTTMLEADAVLLGLESTPVGSKQKSSQTVQRKSVKKELSQDPPPSESNPTP